MAGYSDTRQMIIDTLMGRMAGTEIQPEDHQKFALQITDYIRSVELVAGNANPIGFADADTVPVQPDNGQAIYLSSVGGAQTVTFSNFIGQNGSPISVTSTANVIKLVTLLWNGQYWSSQVTSVNAVRDTTNGYLFMGVATPTTNPGTPDQKVFYLASTAGTYTYFGGLTKEGEITILKYNNSWEKEVITLKDSDYLRERLNKEIPAGTIRSIKKDEFFLGSLQGSETGAPIFYTTIAYSIFLPVVKGANIKFIYPTTISYDGVTYNVGVRVQARKYCNFDTTTNWQLIYEGYDASLDTLLIKGDFNYISFGFEILNLPSSLKAIDIISDGQFSIEYENTISLSPSIIDDYNYSINVKYNEIADKINNNITEINNDITEINNDITEINNDIKGINNNITEINNDIKGINNDITIFEKKNFSWSQNCALLLLDGTIYSQHAPNSKVSEVINIASEKFIKLKDIYVDTGVWKDRAVVAFYNSNDVCIETKAFEKFETLYDTTYKVPSGTSYIKLSAAIYDNNPPLSLYLSKPINEVVNTLSSTNSYVECTSPEDTSVKTISLDGFSLTSNSKLLIKMINKNTANNVKLNINNTGDKDIYINGILADDSQSWLAGDVIEVYYDGTQYQAKFFNKSDEVSIFDLNPEKNVVEMLQQATRVPRLSGTTTQTTPPLVLSIISDIHGRGRQMKRYVKFNEKYESYINDALHLGDSIYDYNPTHTMDFWNNAGANKVLNVIGNHDVYIYPGGGKLTNNETYDKYFKPYVSLWNVTQPSDAELNGYCYYYKDYVTNKVRLIVLDTEHPDAVQRTWFQNTLESARISNLAVIVAEHRPSSLTEFESTSWNSWLSESASTQVYIEDIDTFINNGGEFICHLCGHAHFTKVGKITGHNNQVIVVFDTGAANSTSDRTGDAWCDRSRIENTKSEDLFNILSINTYNKTFSIFRIGSEVDSRLRHQRSICIDYMNKILLYSD